MAEIDGLGKIEPIVLLHEFEAEIRCLVTENYDESLRGIEQREDALLEHIQQLLPAEARESQVQYVGMWLDELRRAAGNMALVALVTRLEHWTRKLIKRLPASERMKRVPTSGLGQRERVIVRDMNYLAARLGPTPIPIGFFDELVTVRDSVIHADSQAEWEYPAGNVRRVAQRYLNQYGDTSITQEHLVDAVEKSMVQVKWYDTEISRIESCAIQ